MREFLFSLTAFFLALLFANHCIVPSRRMNISPVPGSMISPEKLQILCSGIISPVIQFASFSSGISEH